MRRPMFPPSKASWPSSMPMLRAPHVAGRDAIARRPPPSMRASRPPAAPEQLDEQLPSLVVEINGGVVKVDRDRHRPDHRRSDDPARSRPPRRRPGAGGSSLTRRRRPTGSCGDRELVWLTTLDAKGTIHTGFNWGFFTGRRQPRGGTRRHPRRRSSARPMMLVDCCSSACRSASPRRSILRSSRRRTADRRHRGQHQQLSPPCHPSSSACSASPSSSISSACRARRRWSAAWCWPSSCCRPSSSPRAPR